jgi:hypothetical protein
MLVNFMLIFPPTLIGLFSVITYESVVLEKWLVEFKTPGKLPIIQEESMEYTPPTKKPSKISSHNCLDLGAHGLWLIKSKNSQDTGQKERGDEIKITWKLWQSKHKDKEFRTLLSSTIGRQAGRGGRT